METRKADIFSSSSQSLLSSLTRSVMSTSIFSGFEGSVALPDFFAFGLGLIVLPTRICFGFERSVDLQKGVLFAFFSSELLNLEDESSFSDS